MPTFLISQEQNLNPFIYFHGTSSAFSEKIESNGIISGDYQMMNLAIKANSLYERITNFSLDGFNISSIYDGFDAESITRINFAYHDILGGRKNNTFLTFFDYLAIPYSRRFSGEFYSGLIDFVKHLEWMLENYDAFDSKRRDCYDAELKRWKNIHGAAFSNWIPYQPISKGELQFELRSFSGFRKNYETSFNKHTHGLIYVCELSPEKLINSEYIKASSIAVTNVEPKEIIDKIIVTKEMEDNFTRDSTPYVMLKHTYYNQLKADGSKLISLTSQLFKDQFLTSLANSNEQQR